MRKKLKKLLIIGVALVILATTFVYGCGKGVETYNKFGFSFDYPADMEVAAEGLIGFSEEANEEAGVLDIEKPGLALEVFWLPIEDAGRSVIGKIQGGYLAGRKEGHNFYLGDGIESKHMGHTVLGARFVTEGEEGILLNVIGSWYCDHSKRVFTISSGANWDAPQFVMVFEIGKVPKTEPEWPDSNDDPSYKAYKKVMRSLQCH